MPVVRKLGRELLGAHGLSLPHKISLDPQTVIAVFLDKGVCLAVCVVPRSLLCVARAGEHPCALVAVAYRDKHNALRQTVLDLAGKLVVPCAGDDLLHKKLGLLLKKFGVAQLAVLRDEIAYNNGGNYQKDYRANDY